MKNLTNKEIKAIEKAIENCGYELTDNIVERWYKDYTVTINKGKDGQFYAWCMVDENNESVVNIDTLEELSKVKIEKLFY